jgi:hypothetical protein
MPVYDEGLYLWFCEDYTQDPKDQYANTISALNAGVIDVNEARLMLGFEPREDLEEDEVDGEVKPETVEE